MKLQWREPLAYYRALAREEGIKKNPFIPVLIVLAFVAFAVGWALYHGRPLENSWALTIGLSSGTGFLMAYVLPFILSFASDTITLTDDGIERKGIKGTEISWEKLRWEDVSAARLEWVEVEGQQFQLLILEVGGKELAGAPLPDTLSVKRLRAIFANHGIQVEGAANPLSRGQQDRT